MKGQTNKYISQADEATSFNTGASPAQRKCMSHVLRNVAAVLEQTAALVENENATVNAEGLILCLEPMPTRLQRVVDALKEGSYCCIPEDECEYVSRFVGCTACKS